MSRLLRFTTKMPLPTGTKLGWQRLLLDRAYAKDISAARKAKDTAKVQTLETDRRFEIDMHDEEKDAYRYSCNCVDGDIAAYKHGY